MTRTREVVTSLPARDEFISGNGAGATEAAAGARLTLAVDDLDLQPLRRALWAHVQAHNDPPTLFTSGVRLARVRPVAGVRTRLIMEEHGAPSFQAYLADLAVFERKGKGRRTFLVAPPSPLVAAMLADATPPVPALTRVVTAPLVAPDGTIVSAPGYHAATRTYFAPAPDLGVPPIPARPSAAEIAQARDLWLEIVHDFPFATVKTGTRQTIRADRTHALVAGLTPFGRDLVDGPTPLFLFEAPQWGTGKTLLAGAMFFPFLGELDSVQPEPESPAEWRKRLTTLLCEGVPVAVIDNAHDELRAGPLMTFITSRAWQDRILSVNRSAHYDNRLIVAVTGNNVVVSGEALRRCVRIRLIAKTATPWTRESFTHPDLGAWLRAQRGALIAAALTLWQAWLAAGRPGPADGTPALGKFEAWRHALGGLCVVAGLPDFLGNMPEFYRETVTTDEPTETFVRLWWEKYQRASVPPVPELFDLAGDANLAFDGRSRQAEVVAFGIWLAKLRDRVFSIPGESRESRATLVTVMRGEARPGGVRRWRLVDRTDEVDDDCMAESPDSPQPLSAGEDTPASESGESLTIAPSLARARPRAKVIVQDSRDSPVVPGHSETCECAGCLP